ncbi:RNA polymerase sigma factor [Streptomyces litchfieldiae]|uniref:Sigma-70 family RNA polymerase sigma factor n=1 Tax=Streptomyces litchfieldiae TaxID=3075543 RepID=A0ABU2MMA8_9ACTN|nr:sigma-70 family RNA polymerase sigma factor [Streptomyces sp. DSM 44938]MDT0342068.1 sigma-70 family RNA polymerase sigma factor [Streptomyces sp. DSM 44938]
MESEAQADEFDRLFRSTFRRVLAYCLRRTSETAAHDAVSEVYAVAWRKRRHVPDEEHDAALWLLGIARNVLANQARGQRRWARLIRRAAQQPAEPPPSVSTDGAPDLASALAALSAADQEILRLTYWDELPHRDIAVVLGISVGAVATRLHRARERLRAALATQSKEKQHARR